MKSSRRDVPQDQSYKSSILRPLFSGCDSVRNTQSHLVHDLCLLVTGYVQNLSLLASVNSALAQPEPMQTSFPPDHTFHGLTVLPTH